MTKYSSDFKLKIVKEYLEGSLSAASLARKYSISSSGGVKGWIKEYRLRGRNAFKKGTKEKRVYSSSFKENAVHLYLTSDLTYQEVSYQLDIRTIGLLCTWVNQYRKYGEIPEPRKRGRKRNNELKLNMNSTPNYSSEEDQERIKELEKELRYAKIEAEYLKGLRRLGNKVQMNKKQDLSIISEKNTN